MRFNDLIEEVAMRFYWNEGGMGPEEYQQTYGKKKPNWRIHHKFQENQPVLAEHERDDYRVMAEKVLIYLLHEGFIELKKIRPQGINNEEKNSQ